MYRLIESIRLEDGHFGNLAYHEKRMELALKSLYQDERKIELKKILLPYKLPVQGLHKCRLLYDNKSFHAEFTPYQIRPVRSIRVVVNDEIEYEHKYLDRSDIKKCFDQREACDDVLMVKRGLVSDTSYANIALRKGNEWFTPSSCLLAGTMRAYLLEQKMIREEEIGLTELGHFDSFRLINAMLRWDAQEAGIENIVLS